MIFKCKMCGGSLNVHEGQSVVECEYCDSKQTLPKLDNDKKISLFERANYYRSKCEFDKAVGVYESILAESPSESEASWGVCLCRYGIEYVVDPRSQKRIPTCHRAQFKSILDDDDYKNAIANADEAAKVVYEQEAIYIDSVQKSILAISSKEEPFDVFICYKESDEHGNRTSDSVEAQKIYNELKREGYKVFFARITLEEKLGSAYEPYIFAALNSAKVMIVIGSEREYFDAVWVKNEWSRYLALIEQGQNKKIIPCYKNMSPYDLPEEFASLQALDMSKLAYEQDLVHAIGKIVKKGEKAVTTSISREDADAGSLRRMLQSAETHIKIGNYSDARAIYERINIEFAQNYRGWWGLVKCETRDLSVKPSSFENINKWMGYVKKLATEEEYAEVFDEYKNFFYKIAETEAEQLRDKAQTQINQCDKQIQVVNNSMVAIREEVTKEKNELQRDIAETQKNVNYYRKLVRIAETAGTRKKITCAVMAIMTVILMIRVVSPVYAEEVISYFFLLGICTIVIICGAIYLKYIKRREHLEYYTENYLKYDRQLQELIRRNNVQENEKIVRVNQQIKQAESMKNNCSRLLQYDPKVVINDLYCYYIKGSDPMVALNNDSYEFNIKMKKEFEKF